MTNVVRINPKLSDMTREAHYLDGYRIGAKFAARLNNADVADGAIDALLAPYYRGALAARARLARELRAYIVTEQSPDCTE